MRPPRARSLLTQVTTQVRAECWTRVLDASSQQGLSYSKPHLLTVGEGHHMLVPILLRVSSSYPSSTFLPKNLACGSSEGTVPPGHGT